jgi:diguanylate cyclase (GGDEF)-like protein
LEQEALVDPLTGLLNRRALERDLRREFGRAGRHRSSVSVMVVDVDGLKMVNDTEGHLAGDQCLRAVAVALSGVLRSSDAAYRTGGDEFIVMLPDAERETADLVAARAVGAGSPPFSWGVASFPEEADSVDALIDLADYRLYEQRRLVRRSKYRN